MNIGMLDKNIWYAKKGFDYNSAYYSGVAYASTGKFIFICENCTGVELRCNMYPDNRTRSMFIKINGKDNGPYSLIAGSMYFQSFSCPVTDDIAVVEIYSSDSGLIACDKITLSGDNVKLINANNDCYLFKKDNMILSTRGEYMNLSDELSKLNSIENIQDAIKYGVDNLAILNNTVNSMNGETVDILKSNIPLRIIKSVINKK